MVNKHKENGLTNLNKPLFSKHNKFNSFVFIIFNFYYNFRVCCTNIDLKPFKCLYAFHLVTAQRAHSNVRNLIILS